MAHKKKIIITMFSMFIGGAERSLIGLLNALDCEKYDVTLMVYKHKGELMKIIPSKIKLMSEIPQYDVFEVPIRKLLFSKKILFGVARVLARIHLFINHKVHKTPISVWSKLQYNTKYLLPLLPKIPGEYDMAIGFIGIHDVLAKRIKAKTKLGWIHTDYNHIFPDPKLDIKTYNLIDYIVNVSEECQNSFIKKYPQFSSKALVIENILSPTSIKEQANLFEVSDEMPEENSINLLSVGRFSKAKNFDNVPFICERLLEKGLNVKWYLIGYGAEENLIKAKITEANMENNVILLGKKQNPYPYIKACNIYIQPSRYEGKAVTVREAQILGKSVIITDFPTSKSQIENNIDGIIVPLDNNLCADGIAGFIIDFDKQNSIKCNLYKKNFENKSEVEKIYKLL